MESPVLVNEMTCRAKLVRALLNSRPREGCGLRAARVCVFDIDLVLNAPFFCGVKVTSKVHEAPGRRGAPGPMQSSKLVTTKSPESKNGIVMVQTMIEELL